MRYKIKAGAIVKENKTGGSYTWHDIDEIFEIVNGGKATLSSENYSGEQSVMTDWDNLIEVKDEPATVPE